VWSVPAFLRGKHGRRHSGEDGEFEIYSDTSNVFGK
jgi:hypothetical protein